MSLRQSKLQAALYLAAALCVLLWLSATAAGWRGQHSLERGQNLRGGLHNGGPATQNFYCYPGQDNFFCPILDAMGERDELAVEAESLSEPLKLRPFAFKANTDGWTAFEKASSQPPADPDWVFVPDACVGPANRTHAPPASV